MRGVSKVGEFWELYVYQWEIPVHSSLAGKRELTSTLFDL